MRAVTCFRQVPQADRGQPGQARLPASQRRQGGDALAVGQFGGPLQHPAPGHDPQPGPGSVEVGLEYHAVAHDNLIRHSDQSTGTGTRRTGAIGPVRPVLKVSTSARVPGEDDADRARTGTASVAPR